MPAVSIALVVVYFAKCSKRRAARPCFLFLFLFCKLHVEHEADGLVIIPGELYTVEHGLSVNLISSACITSIYWYVLCSPMVVSKRVHLPHTMMASVHFSRKPRQANTFPARCTLTLSPMSSTRSGLARIGVSSTLRLLYLARRMPPATVSIDSRNFGLGFIWESYRCTWSLHDWKRTDRHCNGKGPPLSR